MILCLLGIFFLYMLIVIGNMRYYEKCTGFCLLNLWRFQIELWICPANFRCPLHKHANIHSILWFLRGDMTLIRRIPLDGKGPSNAFIKFPKYWFRKFYLAPNQYHGFNVGDKTLVFLNFQRWTSSNITSAAVDFQPLNNN